MRKNAGQGTGLWGLYDRAHADEEVLLGKALRHQPAGWLLARRRRLERYAARAAAGVEIFVAAIGDEGEDS